MLPSARRICVYIDKHPQRRRSETLRRRFMLGKIFRVRLIERWLFLSSLDFILLSFHAAVDFDFESNEFRMWAETCTDQA